VADQPPTVIVVDDDPASSNAVVQHLRAAGYHPLIPARATVDAIQTLQPSVILLRLAPNATPGGLFALSEALSRQLPHVPIVLYATAVSAATLQLAMAAGGPGPADTGTGAPADAQQLSDAAVADLEAVFASDWKFATGAEPGTERQPEPRFEGVGFGQHALRRRLDQERAGHARAAQRHRPSRVRGRSDLA